MSLRHVSLAALRNGRSGSDRRGFTLLEILMALALIALLAGVLVSGSARLLRDEPDNPYDVFIKAMAEARKYAVENDVDASLSYDKESREFRISTFGDTGDAVVQEAVPVTTTSDVQVDFLVPNKGTSLLLGGVVVETSTVPSVTFYPDGTCADFRIQIITDKVPEVTKIDRWTCAPMLEESSS